MQHWTCGQSHEHGEDFPLVVVVVVTLLVDLLFEIKIELVHDACIGVVPVAVVALI